MVTFRQWLEMKYLEWQRSQVGRKTVLQFATYLGVSQPTLSSWLNETRVPQDDNIRKLADKLGLEVYDILGLERPNEGLFLVTKYWDDLPEEIQEAIIELAEENHKNERSKAKRSISDTKVRRKARPT